MAHWKSMTEREYLYAFDLQGRDVDVRIAKVKAGAVTGLGGKKSKKPIAWFEGKDKPLALNATNCKTIASIVGSHDTDAWAGAWVTLYATTCAAASGETVDCIRIRPSAPQRGARSRGSEPVDPGGAP